MVSVAFVSYGLVYILQIYQISISVHALILSLAQLYSFVFYTMEYITRLRLSATLRTYTLKYDY